MPTITEIEKCFIRELNNNLPYLKTCDSLAEFLIVTIEELPDKTPAVYVVYQGGPFTLTTGDTQYADTVFSLIAVARNVRADESARHGRDGVVGVYEILDDIRQYMTNNDLGLEMTRLRPLDVEALDGNEELAIYAARFSSQIRFDL